MVKIINYIYHIWCNEVLEDITLGKWFHVLKNKLFDTYFLLYFYFLLQYNNSAMEVLYIL